MIIIEQRESILFHQLQTLKSGILSERIARLRKLLSQASLARECCLIYFLVGRAVKVRKFLQKHASFLALQFRAILIRIIWVL